MFLFWLLWLHMCISVGKTKYSVVLLVWFGISCVSYQYENHKLLNAKKIEKLIIIQFMFSIYNFLSDQLMENVGGTRNILS